MSEKNKKKQFIKKKNIFVFLKQFFLFRLNDLFYLNDVENITSEKQKNNYIFYICVHYDFGKLVFFFNTFKSMLSKYIP